MRSDARNAAGGMDMWRLPPCREWVPCETGGGARGGEARARAEEGGSHRGGCRMPRPATTPSQVRRVTWRRAAQMHARRHGTAQATTCRGQRKHALKQHYVHYDCVSVSCAGARSWRGAPHPAAGAGAGRQLRSRGGLLNAGAREPTCPRQPRRARPSCHQQPCPSCRRQPCPSCRHRQRSPWRQPSPPWGAS